MEIPCQVQAAFSFLTTSLNSSVQKFPWKVNYSVILHIRLCICSIIHVFIFLMCLDTVYVEVRYVQKLLAMSLSSNSSFPLWIIGCLLRVNLWLMVLTNLYSLWGFHLWKRCYNFPFYCSKFLFSAVLLFCTIVSLYLCPVCSASCRIYLILVSCSVAFLCRMVYIWLVSFLEYSQLRALWGNWVAIYMWW